MNASKLYHFGKNCENTDYIRSQMQLFSRTLKSNCFSHILILANFTRNIDFRITKRECRWNNPVPFDPPAPIISQFFSSQTRQTHTQNNIGQLWNKNQHEKLRIKHCIKTKTKLLDLIFWQNMLIYIYVSVISLSFYYCVKSFVVEGNRRKRTGE